MKLTIYTDNHVYLAHITRAPVAPQPPQKRDWKLSDPKIWCPIFIVLWILAVTLIVSTAFSQHHQTTTITCSNGTGNYDPNPVRGYTTCVQKADGEGPFKATHYSPILYTPSLCLLPSDDEGYADQIPIRCVNDGRLASPQDLAALVFADQCLPGMYVPCSPSVTPTP